MLVWIAKLVLLEQEIRILEQLDHAVHELQHRRGQIGSQKTLLASVRTRCSNHRLQEAFIGDHDKLIQSLHVYATLLVYGLFCPYDQLLEKARQQDDQHPVFVHLELGHEATYLLLLVHPIVVLLVVYTCREMSLIVMHVAVCGDSMLRNRGQTLEERKHDELPRREHNSLVFEGIPLLV